MINPTDALVALMTEWILKACHPRMSNLQVLLRFQLRNFQPYSHGRWALILEYFTLPHFQARKGSKVWSRIGVSWRSLVKKLQPVSPQIVEEVASKSLW